MSEFTEEELSILCGLADLGKIGWYPPDEDLPKGDICSACTWDAIVVSVRETNFGSALDFGSYIYEQNFPGCFDGPDVPSWGMALATADDVAWLLTDEDDE